MVGGRDELLNCLIRGEDDDCLLYVFMKFVEVFVLNLKNESFIKVFVEKFYW